MAQKMFARLVAAKTLILVVFAVLSLAGIAHAQSTNAPSAHQGGNAYNFTAGGGG